MTIRHAPVNPAALVRHILIVDDSVGMRTYMRTILTAVGLICEEATDGADAFQKLLSGRFDLLVTDLEMPHMDGYALLSAIGLLPAAQKPPVVVCSARLDLSQPVQRPELKMAAKLLEKPVDAGDLIAAVKDVLGLHARNA
jgi:CheY-like chemotaxis protein